MNATDFASLLPLIVIAVTSIVVMLSVAFKRNHTLVYWLTRLGLIISFLSLWFVYPIVPHQITELLVLDKYSIFFMGVILIATYFVAVLTHAYLDKFESNKEEFYIVLLIATLGTMVMVSSEHFVSFFLGLELLTVSLYVMIAYLRNSERPLEAGAKYLILAAASSAFLLFGMALVYSELGTMNFETISLLLKGNTSYNNMFLMTGLALMVVGIGFKLAVAPFHMWTPDVYEGAPSPVTAYIATVSKGGMFALLLRYFYQINGYDFGPILVIFSVIAIASMFLGNLLALMQQNVKRILAYSSIAHLGYMLVAFIAGGELAVDAIAYYLVVYMITTLAAFGIIALVSTDAEEKDSVDDYRGLFWKRPWISVVFTAALLSLAGIPLTAGFIGKYYVLTVGVGGAQWLLVFILIINSTIGLFYYLRIVVAMLSKPQKEEALPVSINFGGGLVLAVLTLLLVWFGVYPSPLLQLIRATVGTLLS